MKRIIKNNYQPNSVRVICKSDPEFDLEAEEFSVYRNGEVYIERQMLHEDAQDRGYVSLSYKRIVI